MRDRKNLSGNQLSLTLLIVLFSIILCFVTSHALAGDVNDFSSLGRNAKKVTLKFRGYWPDADTSPSNGIELNRAFEELDSVHALSYVTSNQNSITRLIEILNESVVKVHSSEVPQLVYVNFLMTFELKDQTKTQLLIGRYYEADNTIEAELKNNKDKIKTIMLDKIVHKALRDWVLQYAQIDKEKAFNNFQKECQFDYSRRIKDYEESETQQNKLWAERGQARPSGIDTRYLLSEGYKAKLAKCNDLDNSDYQKQLKRHHDSMLVNYFKNDTSQICDRHDLYHTDPSYCAARGEWQPSYNHWNINNLEGKTNDYCPRFY